MPRALRWTLVAAVIAALVFVVFRIFGGGMPVEVAAVRNGGVLQVTNVAEEKVTFQVAKKGSKGWSYVTIRGNSGKRVTLSPGKTWRRNLSKGQYQVVIGDERSDVVTLTR